MEKCPICGAEPLDKEKVRREVRAQLAEWFQDEFDNMIIERLSTGKMGA